LPQSVRHQSAARDHREAVRFRADSKGKSVDGEAHWDGGYTGNPPLYPLVHECRSRDLVIVLLLPLSRPATPTTAEAIRSRLTEIHFNTTFLTEMRDLALSRRAARRATLFRGRLEQRLLDLNLHMIGRGPNRGCLRTAPRWAGARHWTWIGSPPERRRGSKR